MESFDYKEYSETLEKFVQLMPELTETTKHLDNEDLMALKKHFEFQSLLNHRMSKKINEILFLKKGNEILSRKC
jgi:hypothetical protein